MAVESPEFSQVPVQHNSRRRDEKRQERGVVVVVGYIVVESELRTETRQNRELEWTDERKSAEKITAEEWRLERR